MPHFTDVASIQQQTSYTMQICTNQTFSSFLCKNMILGLRAKDAKEKLKYKVFRNCKTENENQKGDS